MYHVKMRHDLEIGRFPDRGRVTYGGGAAEGIEASRFL